MLIVRTVPYFGQSFRARGQAWDDQSTPCFEETRRQVFMDILSSCRQIMICRFHSWMLTLLTLRRFNLMSAGNATIIFICPVRPLKIFVRSWCIGSALLSAIRGSFFERAMFMAGFEHHRSTMPSWNYYSPGF